MTVVESVLCEFRNCDASIVARVVLAAVDQLCVDTAVGLDILESLEFPVGEIVDAMHTFVVSGAEVSLHDDTLTVRLHVDRSVPDATALLGEWSDVISSFFEVGVSTDSCTVELTGSLR